MDLVQPVDEYRDEVVSPASTGALQADTRFKAGVSGNPAGRPKGAKNFATIFKRAKVLVDGIQVFAQCFVAVFFNMKDDTADVDTDVLFHKPIGGKMIVRIIKNLLLSDS